MRKIIEDYYGSTGEAPEIEFLPLQIFHRRKHDVLLGEWWYLNVFHWKEVFDLSRSKGVVYYRPPAEWADMDRAQFQARFAYDGKQIYEAEDLAPLPQAYEGGFYLAKLPYHRVLSNLFVGYELGRLMKEKCPAKKEIAFQRKRFGTDHMNGIVPPQTPEEKAEVDSWIVKD
jgi:hypothetical protein